MLLGNITVIANKNLMFYPSTDTKNYAHAK